MRKRQVQGLRSQKKRSLHKVNEYFSDKYNEEIGVFSQTLCNGSFDRYKAVIWFITEDAKLPLKTKSIVENSKNNCFVSIATYWEIAIKYSPGRLNLNSGLDDIFRIIENTGFELLPITPNQILINVNYG